MPVLLLCGKTETLRIDILQQIRTVTETVVRMQLFKEIHNLYISGACFNLP